MIKKYFLGLIFILLITYGSCVLGITEFSQQNGLSSLTLAIILGIFIGNTVYPFISNYCHYGVNFSKSNLLRLGIILYGFRLTFQQIIDVGIGALIIDLLIVILTYSIGVWLGKHLFKLPVHTSILVSSGASICGAAAVLATAPLIKARSNNIAVAVATVVVFGTLSLFLYPIFYHTLANMGVIIGEKQFGIYIGSTIHEVAQVVAAGNAVGCHATDNAVITKMVRVMLLAPFLLWLSIALTRRKPTIKNTNKITIPWFAIGFIIMVCINSTHILPTALVNGINQLDTILLTMAMAALGLTTHLSAIKQAGIKPLLLAMTLFIWLVIGGAGLNYLLDNVPL